MKLAAPSLNKVHYLLFYTPMSFCDWECCTFISKNESGDFTIVNKMTSGIYF